jgi:aromatic-L-amino-acid decarboxylase
MIDLPPDQFRRLGHRAVDLVADYLAALPQRPCRLPVPADVRQSLMNEPLPETGCDADALLDYVESVIFRYPMGNGSPRFFAWANSPPAPIAVIGDLLAAALNPSVAGGDHAATYVEHAVLAWMRAIVGMPADGGGILTSGGSVANLTGLAVMRHVRTHGAVRADGLGGGAPALVVYTSTEGHSCIQKAVELLGIGHANLRRVRVTSDWRLDVQALEAQIRADRAAGLQPACVTATAGTVNTGAIDPLEEVADLCRAENLWFHVDASLGGPAALVPELAHWYRGIERADSLAIDPHKWMYVPVECGCALVRDAAAMRNAFSLVPPYLRDEQALPWFSEFGIQQSRGFRALKLWLVLKQNGVQAFRESIARDIGLARALRHRLEQSPDFQVVASGPLSVVCFRYLPVDTDTSEQVDLLNRNLLDQVQREGRVFLTGTELDGRFVLRASVMNFHSTDRDIDTLVATLRSAGAGLTESRAYP